MTEPRPAVITYPEPTAPSIPTHCTGQGCTRTDTATVDGVWGRRCEDHPPTLLIAHAIGLLLDGLPGAALAYLRTDLA